ncbi:MAG: YggT family protein [Pseudomonadota bacterium]|nr:YggT family protein [Gammaproteobacteria bacterium]MEC9357628.1 YggT family protein [Pseudomonadota bacterium]
MSANVNNAFYFLVNTLLQLYLMVMILRILLQLVRADFYNPVCQVIWKVTQPLVDLPGRVLPRYRNIDVAGILVTYVCTVIYIYVIFAILGLGVPLIQALWFAVLKMAWLTLQIYTFSLLIQAVLSWVGPGYNNPAGSILWSLNEPLLRPVRRVIPPISGLDLSPLVVILLLQVLARLIGVPGILR